MCRRGRPSRGSVIKPAVLSVAWPPRTVRVRGFAPPRCANSSLLLGATRERTLQGYNGPRATGLDNLMRVGFGDLLVGAIPASVSTRRLVFESGKHPSS